MNVKLIFGWMVIVAVGLLGVVVLTGFCRTSLTRPEATRPEATRVELSARGTFPTSSAVSNTTPTNGPLWGFWAHRRINFMAVFTLHGELFDFFKKNIDYLTEHAVDPDKRRYAIPEEAPRHYIDIDHYGDWPYEMLPRQWDSAVAVFGEDSLIAYGILPWNLERSMYRLRSAFRLGDAASILKIAAELGHYIGDAHVPLHCTQNYNGDMTGQHGIHGFWESRLPELFGESYDYLVGQSEYINDVSGAIWRIILDSGVLSDSVLHIEQRLNGEFRQDKKYSYESRAGGLQRVYSREYSKAFQTRLDHMVEDRMRASIIDLGNFWFTAWVDAGRPDLSGITIPESSQSEQDSLNIKFRMKHIFGRKHDD